MPLSFERVLPHLSAVAAGAAAALLVGIATGPTTSGRMLTVAHAVAAGSVVTPGDLTLVPVPPVRLPVLRSALYAAYALSPGQPLVAGALTASPPRRTAAVGSGMVAENVTLPAGAVPAGVAPGDTVAVAGATAAGQGLLLAPAARVVAVAGVAAVAGSAAAVVYTLALPLGSALAVAQAVHAGTLVLLPWSLPRTEVQG